MEKVVDNEKKKIYLLGKISGDPEFKEKFALKEQELTKQGYHVFNPALHPDMFTWEQFMEIDLKALGNCDAIVYRMEKENTRKQIESHDSFFRIGR